MIQETRHAAGSMMLGQPIRCQNIRKPRIAGRSVARSIIYDTAIARPGEAPAVSEIVFGLTRVPFVHAVAIKNAGVNPTTARSRSVGFQFVVIGDLGTVMGIALAVDSEH